MSGLKWKPGDVALVECSDGEWRQAWCMDLFRVPAWHFANGLMRDVSTSKARPLVVIDPEDREQVEHLWRSTETALPIGPTRPQYLDAMQAALRSLITPPKPEVYEHLATQERQYGDYTTVTSLCGKEWTSHSRSEVTILGRCPDCEHAVAAGWVA